MSKRGLNIIEFDGIRTGMTIHSDSPMIEKAYVYQTHTEEPNGGPKKQLITIRLQYTSGATGDVIAEPGKFPVDLKLYVVKERPVFASRQALQEIIDKIDRNPVANQRVEYEVSEKYLDLYLADEFLGRIDIKRK